MPPTFGPAPLTVQFTDATIGEIDNWQWDFGDGITSTSQHPSHTYEQAGRKEQAIKAFQQVCKRFPKDHHASTAHAHLQSEYNISITLGGAKDE